MVLFRGSACFTEEGFGEYGLDKGVYGGKTAADDGHVDFEAGENAFKDA